MIRCGLMPDSGLTPLPAVKGFQILELLGEGGFGSVHLARQESTRQLVALKIQFGISRDSVWSTESLLVQ